MESFSLFLNSFSGSPYVTTRNSPNDVIFTINWDALFNLNNHKYRRCKLRHDFSTENAVATNPFIPTTNNGVLVVNGIVPRTSSTTGGLVLGLIEVDSVAVTNNVTSHQSATTTSNFVGSIAASTANLTISSTSSPLFMLAAGDVITFYDPNNLSYQTRTIASITGPYTYTLTIPIGSTAVTNSPMTAANPVTTCYTYMKSTSLQSVVGIEIEVPRGYRQLEVQLVNNNYGQVTNGVVQSPLISGNNLQDWGLMLNFEFYDPVPDQFNQ